MNFDPETVTVARAALGLISVPWLRCQDAHPDHVLRFEREFGGEMWLTRSTLVRLGRANFKIEWLVDRILAAPARTAFRRSIAPINRAYHDTPGDSDEAWERRQIGLAEVLADLLGLPAGWEEGDKS